MTKPIVSDLCAINVPGKPVTKFAFSPPLSGPLAITTHQRGALLPGSGSGYSTLSLAYLRRQLAINPSPTQIARLISDRGIGVRMLELTCGRELWI